MAYHITVGLLTRIFKLTQTGNFPPLVLPSQNIYILSIPINKENQEIDVSSANSRFLAKCTM